MAEDAVPATVTVAGVAPCPKIELHVHPGLVRELAARGTVLDVCPLSNLRLGMVASLADHPLPRLVAAGVRCSISTDDPAMFGTDLTLDYEAATALGHDPRSFYEAGVTGALCDDDTRARLRQIGESYDWAQLGFARWFPKPL